MFWFTCAGAFFHASQVAVSVMNCTVDGKLKRHYATSVKNEVKIDKKVSHLYLET